MQPIRKAVDFMKSQTSSSQVQIGAYGGQKQGANTAVDTPGAHYAQDARNVASVIGRVTPTNGAAIYKSNDDSPLIIVETSYDITVPVKYRLQHTTEEDHQLMQPQRI